ncbi:ABC transporter substrate-binding protein [Nitrincola tapanii]|uniref:ABC transporter permease n=1 Tax=Nitrincola tapanii TaxID=1708751 RepID=A0A5A9W050_9GAMM|nr:ABC transporter substrate-binding protein [Nitrincola tapanii]KAA0873599.1 ABC transporter permease [Nitrincola tapanii]
MANKNNLRHLMFGLAGSALLLTPQAYANETIKIGVMLPFSGAYAALGSDGRNGLRLALKEHRERLHGSNIEFIEMDTEARPERAPEISSALLNRHKADFIVGPVHSGVANGMLRTLRNRDTIMIVPNAGSAEVTGALCAPNVFRTSFSSWQTSYPMGQVAADKGYKRVVTITWNYGMGRESVDAFEESFTAAGGEIIRKMLVPFPRTDFQSYISEIASLQPDAVFVFFAGSGAVQFALDYDALGLRERIPLIGSGFLTEGTLGAQGKAAEGLVTTLHYADELDNPNNVKFRELYKSEYNRDADLYAVQGYDAGLMIVEAIDQLQGKVKDRQAVIEVMRNMTVPSPRGDFTFSKAHNPIQNVYLREVKDGVNRVIDVAMPALEDPARGCNM